MNPSSNDTDTSSNINPEPRPGEPINYIVSIGNGVGVTRVPVVAQNPQGAVNTVFDSMRSIITQGERTFLQVYDDDGDLVGLPIDAITGYAVQKRPS